MGEFTLKDLVTLKLKYVLPPPERFMELFKSKSLNDFIIPHLIIYLALPLIIPAVIYLGSFLFATNPWLSMIAISMTVIGTVYMGGVFGSWLSFIAVGNVNADQITGTIPALTALIKKQGMLKMSNILGGLSLLGFLIIAAGLFYTGAIPRWQSALIFVGNLMIIIFMDIDNLMLAASVLWLIGVLPFLAYLL